VAVTKQAAADAAAEYARRLAARRAEAEARARRDRRLSNLRLLVFAIGALTCWLVFVSRDLATLWLALPVLAFAALVVLHDRAIRARQRAERSAAFYARGLRNLDGTWVADPATSEERRDPVHPYADDLDCFGRGSLFERMSRARTRAAEDVLAAWLRTPADPHTIRARQAAVGELAPALDLREDLALLGDDLRAELSSEHLREWGEAPPRLTSSALRGVALFLPGVTLLALLAWIFTGAGPFPFEAALVIQTGFALALRARVREVVRRAELPGQELALFAALVARIEREAFESPRLTSLHGVLAAGGVPTSRRISRLRLLTDLLDARRNQLFMPIAALSLWTTQLAFAIEGWRRVSGPMLAPWLDALAEIEALASFAGYAYEHGDHAFPEIVAPSSGVVFEAEAIGHPLLPAERCVRNDVRLDEGRRLLIVSGSNMSGKSTLLRSLGTNAVLALAGAPVCARRLRIAPLQVGASIQLRDSLIEGRSRFYAEIQRLRQIVELAEGERPALFLLDEILHGTNSHDRRLGAEAVIRGLLERGASGAVTTHDLALTRMTEVLGECVVNAHFEDHLEDGAMVFDYRLRPGVVERSNALALMRAVGLEV
jgi:hypothetical protein